MAERYYSVTWTWTGEDRPLGDFEDASQLALNYAAQEFIGDVLYACGFEQVHQYIPPDAVQALGSGKFQPQISIVDKDT